MQSGKNYFKLDKLFYHLENVAARRPVTADIDVVNFCNQACYYCYYHRGSGEMSVDVFYDVVRILQQQGVKAVNLTGTGEPLLHSQIDRICAVLNNLEVPYGVKTNLSVMPPDNCSAVWIKVSLDASSSEEYSETRGVDHYSIVLDNIRAVSEKFPQTTLGIQCMVGWCSGSEQADRFHVEHALLPVDYMVFRPIAQIGGGFYSEEQQREMADFVHIVRAKDKRVVQNADKWLFKNEPNPCPMNFLTAYVNWKAELLYCCDKQYEIIGAVSAEAFRQKEAWQTDIATCNVPCRMFYYNRQFAERQGGFNEHSNFL